MSAGIQVEHLNAEVVEATSLGRIPAYTNQDDLRMFLVACHQASVSVDTMSSYLGIDEDTVRTELLRGIESWNAGRRRVIEFSNRRQ